MPDAIELANKIKIISVNAVEATKPMHVLFGKVVSDSPLTINIEPKIDLGEKQLILTRNVTEYEVEMTVEHQTEVENEHTHEVTVTCVSSNGSTATAATKTMDHLHDYTGRKPFTVHNALTVGEIVILLRQQGGQKYIVWDRVVMP